MAGQKQAGAPVESAPEAALEGGNYEVLSRRLADAATELSRRADALNDKRKSTFGGTALTVIGNERVRTENNCVPRDIVSFGRHLLFCYNVYIGLKTETRVSDVFSLHKLEKTAEGFDLGDVPPATIGGLLADSTFAREFGELHRYYKDAKLIQAVRREGKFLAVLQTGGTIDDLKVFRWTVDPRGVVTYLDNRGERDYVFPRSHDFEWTPTTREDQVGGRHAHVSILDEVFVETIAGDLTVKIENNTQTGKGVYSEPVDDVNQSLDDGEIHFAKVGTLILLKILPFREETWRYLVFNTRTKSVSRIDEIGQACVQLPEDHGIIFPGGFYLQDGTTKVFDTDTQELRFLRSIRSPNGEDVLFAFYHRVDGRYLLLPYNLIRKEVQNPIQCHGYTLFDDGRMLVFRTTSEEPTRVHPIQVWQTPFTSEEFAAQAPSGDTYLHKVGNADLVRGISDAFGICRAVGNDKPTRQTFEDLIAFCTRVQDQYYWLSNAEVGDFQALVADIKKNTELIVDEFEKVQAIKQRAEQALEQAKEAQKKLVRELRPEDFRTVAEFLLALSALRKGRGHLITLREMRYIDLLALAKLEEEIVSSFDRTSNHCVGFLLTGEAMGPLLAQIELLLANIERVKKGTELLPFQEELEGLNEGLTLLSEVVSTLEIEDATQRTQILEGISEVFGQLNRVRATLQARKKELLSQEGRAEFAAQFKLLGQSVAGAIALSDTPARCDQELSRLMVQLEELEGRFSEFEEFLAELTQKREEVYQAFEGKKQTLLEARQRRTANLAQASDRILAGVARRSKSFKDDDELNAYFASDAMILKLRQMIAQLHELSDTVKADDLESRLKASRQNALRNLKDKLDLFEGGDSLIKLGKHRFNVNTQPFELTLVPKDGGMALHLTGTEFYERIDDAAFNHTRAFWEQELVSESPLVYRAEYLAASIFTDAEDGRSNLSLDRLKQAAASELDLVELVRGYAAERYDEGYERGLHDSDAAKILAKLLTLAAGAGLLRFSSRARAWACLFWAFAPDPAKKQRLSRRAQSLGRLRKAFLRSSAERLLAEELAAAVRGFLGSSGIEIVENEVRLAGRYLVEELVAERPRFCTSSEALEVKDGLFRQLDVAGTRGAFEEDLRALEGMLPDRLSVALAWIEAFLGSVGGGAHGRFALEAAVALLSAGKLDRDEAHAITRAEVEGLLGQHPRVVERKMELVLDEFIARTSEFIHTTVPGYKEYRKVRAALVERERARLRIDEFVPKVLTSFVRNRLLNEVYLPLIGDNLAKQLGAAGEKKRTDLMGLLLLISPPGYGKTTLMEYVCNRLGMVFMKVNGPSLGHAVTSLDPAEAPNATARQEVQKISLAFEMGNNVMLYLDDIQHTNPELLQKFISLCDASRRIEGVWAGRTRTYDLRGKKFAVCMAGNPYTESGEKFQIPDMLANRADVYNLGDILEGKDALFALSYVENALTSNPALAPIAARSLEDMHLLIRMSKGEQVPQTEFQHSYSRAEMEEAVHVLQRFFKAQSLLLKVNLEYIASASMDDRYRTEPPFRLQGSYRNMNKLAEKIVAAMNDAELDALLRDHYQGEAQTLTSGAETNLLKLAELRGTMSAVEKERWDQIKKDFRREQVSGGKDQDPVTRVTSTLNGLGERLDGIRQQLLEAAHAAATARIAREPKTELNYADWLTPHLHQLDQSLRAISRPQLDVQVHSEAPKELGEILAKQAAGIEQSLLPLVRASAQNLEEARTLARPLAELIELLKFNALESNGQGSAGTPKARSHAPRKRDVASEAEGKIEGKKPVSAPARGPRGPG